MVNICEDNLKTYAWWEEILVYFSSKRIAERISSGAFGVM
jgi:hypothetical protein